MSDGGRSNTDIAKRLVALMKATDTNQSAFAAMAGVSPSAMNNYLKGIRRPEIDVAIRIQVKTGASLDWLYLGDRSGLPARLMQKLPDLSEDQKAV